jgi:hypothetical protein
VGSCPPGNTRCIAECIKSRETLGRACIVPKLTGRCNYTSVAIGDGASGVGYGSLRNALAIKFDTWYNYEEADPWLSHVAVHSGGFSDGAPARATQALGLAYDMPDLNDGKYHEVLIEYSPHFDSADAANPLEIATLSRMPAVASRLTSAQRGNLRYLGMLSVHLDGDFEARGEALGVSPPDTPTRLHCTGHLSHADGARWRLTEWSAERVRFSHTVHLDTLHADFCDVGLYYGPAFRTLRSGWMTERTARACAARLRRRTELQGMSHHPLFAEISCIC